MVPSHLLTGRENYPRGFEQVSSLFISSFVLHPDSCQEGLQSGLIEFWHRVFEVLKGE